MPTVPITDELITARVEVWTRHGKSTAKAARELGISEHTVRRCVKLAAQRGLIPDPDQDPAITDAMSAANTNLTPALAWVKTKNEDGTGYSVLLKPPKNDESLADQIREAIAEVKEGIDLSGMPKPPPPSSDNLCVIDLADCHIGKLCIKSETGYEYNSKVAVHRMIEGAKRLRAKSQLHGVGRFLMVMGNDVLHYDNGAKKTTNGTQQDSDGSPYSIFRDGLFAYRSIIEELIATAPVDMLHVPSNHDRLLGWSLTQTVAASFNGHPMVNATNYNISERHRKYYRYEDSLIGLTHGDGAKESDLPNLMMKEAHDHISGCNFFYWFVHHLHHKIRKKQAADGKYIMVERDITGMTIHNIGGAQHVRESRGCCPEIEYVRSPSPPDVWHDVEGYVNMQAVEAYMHTPGYGQSDRFSAWF